jgi:uncharacterized damage-inducible protein DinB
MDVDIANRVRAITQEIGAACTDLHASYRETTCKGFPESLRRAREHLARAEEIYRELPEAPAAVAT